MITLLLVLLSSFTLSAPPVLPAGPLLPTASGDTDSLVIHFGVRRWDLTGEETAAIDNYLAAEKGKGGILTVTLSGYCDQRGSGPYNNRLSLQRAAAVKQYLVEKGLGVAKAARIAGFGIANPVDSDSTEAAWAKNRRVVVVFTRAPGRTERDPASSLPQTTPTPTLTTVSPPDDSVADAPKRPAYVKGPSIREQLADTSIHVGSKLALKNVNFFAGYHIPLPGTTIVLDTLAQAMLDNPNLRLHIDGYICCLPDSSEGKDAQTGHFDLSIQRARFVYDYLVNHKVAKERLAYEGHGSNSKLYPEERDQREQALNRRVEITVVAK